MNAHLKLWHAIAFFLATVFALICIWLGENL